MSQNLKNVWRLWTAKPVYCEKVSFLFASIGFVSQCVFAGTGSAVLGSFLLLIGTAGSRNTEGRKLAASWGFFPLLVFGQDIFAASELIWVLVGFLNFLFVLHGVIRGATTPAKTVRYASKPHMEKPDEASLSDADLRELRRESMSGPLYKFGPVVGRFGGIDIPAWVEDSAGNRYDFLRVETGKVAHLQDGELIIAPGFVFAEVTAAPRQIDPA